MEKRFTTAEAEAIKLEAYERIIDTLDEYSDAQELPWDRYVIRHMAEAWFKAKEELLYAIMHTERYQANEPFKLVHDVDIPRAFNTEACVRYADKVCYCHDEAIPLNDYRKKVALHAYLSMFTEVNITNDDIDRFNIYIRKAFSASDAIHAPKAGQKVSKHVRKLLEEIGFKFLGKSEYENMYVADKLVLHERDFAEFADSISPTVFNRKYVLSADPRDYLLMSHGNSWSSCYCINSDWFGDNYRGCYSSGAWSYMTDEVSLIGYVVRDTDTENYADVTKILRQVAMVDLEHGALLNSRLYPQANDSGANPVYTEIRHCCQALVSEMLNVPNYWAKTNAEVFDKSCEFLGYDDVHIFSDKVVTTYNKSVMETETDDEGKTIPKMRTRFYGGKAYCPSCGDELSDERYICEDCDRKAHEKVCAECGCVIEDEDDLIEFDGNYYCHDCAFWCENCNEYHVGDSHSVRTNWGWETWCEECVDECAFYCEGHDRYEADRNFTEIEYKNADGDTLSACAETIFEVAWVCADCEEYYANDIEAFEGDDGDYYCEDCIDGHKANDEEEDV